MKKKVSSIDIYNLDAVYFIGIGGIGVSALAFWCIKNNIKVFGYDREKTEITSQIELQGGVIFYDCDVISEKKKKDFKHNQVLNSFVEKSQRIGVFSSAIKTSHPIRNFFDTNKVLNIKRAEFLGFISSKYDVIAIAGTHGKTTISTMLTHILKVGGIDCSAFLGGVSKNYNSNFILGSSNIMVVEADEYDKSFFYLQPRVILVSAIDKDHLDTYPTFLDMKNAYTEFILNNQSQISLLILKENLQLKSLALPSILEYSLSRSADYILDYKKGKENNLSLTFLKKKRDTKDYKVLKTFNTTQHPKHNLENFLAASTIALQLGVSINCIAKGINSFLGIKRRFEYHINNKNQIFIEDYAHHPKEIDMLIDSLRLMYNSKKITMIFQPHLFSRTKDFLNEFAASLSKVDTLILLNIYPARESPIKGFSINQLFNLINIESKVLISNEKLVPLISKLKPKVLVSVGAGDITKFSGKLKNVLL